MRSGALPSLDRDRLPKIGAALDFASTSADATPFVTGWGLPEPTGRWTVGSEAVIAWDVGDDHGNLFLHCDGDAFLSAAAPQQVVEVWANDRKMAEWEFALGRPSPLPARVPLALAPDTPILFLTFRIRQPRSPAELGLSDDTRALGLHVRSLAIVAEPGATT